MIKALLALLLLIASTFCKSQPLASNPLSIHLVSFNGSETGNKFEVNWQVESEQAGDMYVVEKRTNGSEQYVEISRITVASDHSSNTYSIKVPLTSRQTFYRLKVLSKNDSVSYSKTISSTGINRQILRTFITGTNLMCKLPPETTSVEIFDAVGKALIKQETDPTATQVNISLANIAKGIITVRALANNDWQVARVLY